MSFQGITARPRQPVMRPPVRKLMSSFGSYVFGWLVGYSGLLGPVAGIMVADYFLIRHTRLDVYSLYHREGPYEYTRGINPRALIALAAGVFAALVGLGMPALRFLYDYAWFVGFFLSAAIYYALMLHRPKKHRSIPRSLDL